MNFDRGAKIQGVAVASIVFLSTLVGPAAADTRPANIQYDQPGTIPTLQPGALLIPRRQITIGDHTITPKTIILDSGEPFGWLNQSRAPSRIVFEREVAHAMVCRSLINFSIKDDELKSSELRINEVANFCELEPGHYSYRIIRTDPSTGASQRIEGAVLVRPRDAAKPPALAAQVSD